MHQSRSTSSRYGFWLDEDDEEEQEKKELLLWISESGTSTLFARFSFRTINRLRIRISYARELPVNTRSNIRGKVEIIKIIKKKAGVKVNCSLTVNLSGQDYKDLDWKRSVSL
ncbi:hypothetical protein POM88_028522 [Heracleum sosnowskyi]|uniref:Uncharacterized protein n=1 Tax=Heracleum sosnowskyi TaxID=360622 RepID=A0AAD8HTB5_9APIA|nr:hypothetical protein POM88_028522 [Heracleum sosnowskyi]